MKNIQRCPECSLLPSLLLALLISSNHAATSPSSSNSSSVTDEIETFLSDASDTFTNFIYSFSDAFLVGVGSSDRLAELNLTELASVFSSSYFSSSSIIDYGKEHWREILMAKIGFVVCVVVGILFVVLMPCIGFFFCCCRCCGNCGGRRFGKKHGGFKKTSCHLTLFIFALILTLFVMGSFIVARRFNGNVKSIVTTTQKANVVVKAVSTVPPAVKELVDGLEGDVESTLKRLVDDIVKKFDRSGRDLSDGFNRALGKANLTDKLEDVDKLLASFLGAGTNLRTLIERSENVGNTSLQSAVTSLIQTLDKCNIKIKSECDTLKGRVADLDADEALKGLPMKRLKEAEDLIKDLKGKDLTSKIREGRDMLGKISGRIESEVDKYKGLVVNVTEDMKEKVNQHIGDMWRHIEPQLAQMETQIGQIVGDLAADEEVLNSGIDYATYAMYGLSAAAGLAVLCLLTAFLAGCCSPKTSADCFMAFTGFYFIFCPLLMLLTLLFYNSLGQVQVEGCQPLLNPQPNEPTMIDQIGRELGRRTGRDIDFDISNVLYQCSQGDPIYKIVRSTHLFDGQLDKILKAVNVDAVFPQVNKSISEVKQLIEDSLNDSLKTLDIDAYTKPLLKALDDVDLDAVFSNVSSAINVKAIKSELAGVNLTSVAEALTEAAVKARAQGEAATAVELDKSAAEFQKLENEGSVEKEVLPLLDAIGNATAQLLEKKNLENETRSIISTLSSAFSSFVSALTSVISTTILEFTYGVFNLIEDAIKNFIDDLSTVSVSCRPLWKVLTMVVGVPCRLLVDPINGYWFEIGGFLGVGLVAIIFAVKVAGILRDEIKAEEDEDQVFDVRNNHVTNHSHVTPTKNQVGYQPPDKYGRGRGGPDPRNQDNIAIEMRERNRCNNNPQAQPPPYEDAGMYRSTENIYRDYNDKNNDYRDGHVNNGYRF